MTAQLSGKLGRSAQIVFAGTLGNGLIQALSVTVLARLLTPYDYGVYAISLSLNAISLQFIIASIEKAVVLLPDEEAAETSFAPVVLLAMLSCVLPFIVFGMAGHWGYQSLSFCVTAILVLAQMINALGIVPRALLRRQLRFGRIVVGEVSGQFFGQFGMSFILAGLGFGASAIAFGFLSSMTISTVIMLSSRPSLFRHLRFSQLGELLRTMRSMTTIAGLEMIAGQAPPFLLGATVGAVVVGLFNRANAIIGLPLQLLTSSLSRVLLTGFSLASKSETDLRDTFLKQLHLTSTICFPIAAGIAASAPAFTLIVLGETWTAAEPYVIPIAAFSALSMTCVIAGTLADSTRHFREKIALQAFDNIFMVVTVVIASRWGALEAVYSLIWPASLRLLLLLCLCARIVKSSLREVASTMVTSVIAAGAVFVAAYSIGQAFAGMSVGLTFLAQVTACGVALLGSLALVDKPFLFAMAASLRSVLRRSAS